MPLLKREVERLRGEVEASLLPVPCFEAPDDTQWTMFKLKPDLADDYPGQEDLFVAKTMLMEMWQTAHTGILFDSRRFSRVGETFCYLKLDGKDGIDEERFADKAEIEDALDAALIPRRLGSFIGGGTGKRYSYIDLALTDLPKAIEVIKSVLREGSVPRRSWLLFFDTVWQDEWVGIWDETPPPPREG